MEFINEHLSGNPKTIVANGSKYLARAITPVWTDAKRTAAGQLIREDRYKAHRINSCHGIWGYTYLDFRPISTSYLPENLVKVWFLKETKARVDTIKPTMAIYADTIKLKGSYIELTENGFSISFLGITIPITGNTTEKIFLFKSDIHYLSLVEKLEQERKYSITQKVSEWDWERSRSTLSLKSMTGLRDYREGDKFELIKVEIPSKTAESMEGTEIPKTHHAYSNTYCNIYASDLARSILFPGLFSTADNKNLDSNYAPWGPNARAATIHEFAIDNKNGHFKSVTFDEAWKYTNAEYVVYLTAYNSKYYEKHTDETKHPGHIATCYQTKGYENGKFLNANIIQAGGDCGVHTFQSIWTEGKYGSKNEHVKANLYLGYIIK
jgi:hypothetical protein